ncbi:MAG: hypothetical protein GX676_05025 [Bacilli bacterium]|nr:hypothetical protein [Bacilli bacterium]
MNDWLKHLGLAYRAGKIVTGEDNIIYHIREKKVNLVIVATNASNNTKKKYFDKCSFYNIQCIEQGTIQDISHAIGKNNRVAVGVTDAGFAKGLLAKILK